MTDAERYARFLMDFEQIIAIDSSSDNPDGIAEVAAFLRDKLVPLGLEVEISRQGRDGTPCLKACTPSREGRYDFLFLGHMDTVFPVGEPLRRPFSVKDGIAHGPGVNDMQGGLLVAVNVMERLKEGGALDDIAICLAFNGDEETGSINSRQWIEEAAAQCDRVLVFEACRPGYKYVMSRKGTLPVRVVAHGRSAHAGADPENGVNAVVELAHQIGRIHALNRPGSGITAQCTVVSGGDKTNVIPEMAMVDVDVRYETMEEMGAVEAFFARLPEETLLPGASVEVTGVERRPPMESGPGSERLLALLAAEGRKLGIEVGRVDSGGCSDGNWTAAMGVPTLDGLGPIGGNAHRQDEYMVLESVIPVITMVSGLCRKSMS